MPARSSAARRPATCPARASASTAPPTPACSDSSPFRFGVRTPGYGRTIDAKTEARSGLEGVELPRALDALQLVLAEGAEPVARPEHQVVHGARHHDLVAAGDG